MERIIWSSTPDYEDWKDYIESEFPESSESDRYGIMYDLNYLYLDDERANLDIELDRPIVIIADIGRWNGRVVGYKVLKEKNINECFYSDDDAVTWYVDRFKDLRCTAHHHDGTNYYLYREFKPSMSEVQIENFLNKIYSGKVTNKDITRCTRKIGDRICNVYGWS